MFRNNNMGAIWINKIIICSSFSFLLLPPRRQKETHFNELRFPQSPTRSNSNLLDNLWNRISLEFQSIDRFNQSNPRKKKWWGKRCRNGWTAPCGLLLLLHHLSTTTLSSSAIPPPPLKCPRWRKRRIRSPLLPRLPPLLRFRHRLPDRGGTVAVVSLANMETLLLVLLLLPRPRTFPARLISQLRSTIHLLIWFYQSQNIFDHKILSFNLD